MELEYSEWRLQNLKKKAILTFFEKDYYDFDFTLCKKQCILSLEKEAEKKYFNHHHQNTMFDLSIWELYILAKIYLS